MIILLSELKKLLPNLSTSGLTLADDLTALGHFRSGYKKLENGDGLYDLEIKAANRPDCLGYIGLARDLAAFYNIKLILPHTPADNLETPKTNDNFEISVTAPNLVQTLRATKLTNLKVGPSPAWLVNLLTCSNINPVNNLVDLTNYIMLLYGIPAHAFDAQKVNNTLCWSKSEPGDSLTTFDGTSLDLKKGHLIIKSGNTPVSMSSIGGDNSGIDETTTSSIIEIAVYDPVQVHHDNRNLNIQTEAGHRLEKYLSPQSVPTAFYHLEKLVTELCQGSPTGNYFVFDNYENNPKPIYLDPQNPSNYAGAKINPAQNQAILSRLGFTCSTENYYIAPYWRTDIFQEEDLIEEVLRIYDYRKIPWNESVEPSQKNDITPAIITLSESIKNILTENGFDEVRSWPVIRLDHKLANICQEQYITLENSMNEEFTTLRQSIIESLRVQVEDRIRFKAPISDLFELGKIFYEKDGRYIEHHAIGLHTNNSDILDLINNQLDTKLQFTKYQNFYQAIISDIKEFKVYDKNLVDLPSYELSGQMTELDATLYLDSKQDPKVLYQKYLNRLDKNILFSLAIKDYYFDIKNNKHNYTFTAQYFNCDSSKAKDVHLAAFELEDFRREQDKVDQKKPTELVYYQDNYLQSLKATILSIESCQDHWVIICDKTIFYPAGGGQPGDWGKIDNIEIFDTTFESGQVLHHTKNKPILSSTQNVLLEINWTHRYKYMQVHTAGHLLHDAIMSLSVSLKPIKGDHGENAYLNYQGELKPTEKDKILAKYLELCNQNLDIVCADLSGENKNQILGNAAGNLPKNKRLRYLKIGNFPAMPDGGVHVKSTSELPQIDIQIENYADISTIKYNFHYE